MCAIIKQQNAEWRETNYFKTLLVIFCENRHEILLGIMKGLERFNLEKIVYDVCDGKSTCHGVQ